MARAIWRPEDRDSVLACGTHSQAPAGTLVPPTPTWSAKRCGVGFDDNAGCRECVDACPYAAIRTLAAPGGLRIHIDADACQRCGACTSACPTSALTRAYLPDQEIDARVAESVRSAGADPVVVFAHPSSRSTWGPIPAGSPIAAIELPSLLILNETHLLQALRCGARGVAILGHPAGHHGAPHLFATPLRLTRAALPPEQRQRVIYLEDEGVARTTDALTGFIQELPARGLHRDDASPPPGSHRDRFAALVTSALRASVAVNDVPFGIVAVTDADCTLCGACSRVCPTGALAFHEKEGTLGFQGVDCIGCGLCEQACPEKAVTLDRRLTLAPALFERTILVEDQVLPCRGCGEPHQPLRLLEHARKIIASAGASTLSVRQIDLCPDCRSVAAESAPPGQARAEAGCGIGQTSGVSRRSFLGSLQAAVGGLVAAATGKAEAATSGTPPAPAPTKRLGMVVDLNRCIGCHACTAACKAENQVPLGVYRDWVEEHVLGEYPHATPYFLPKLCNQCTDPGCLRACPTGALHMRPDGIVNMNHDICIGCRACNQACPYGAAYMDPVRGTADKCNFCTHRIDTGLNPACVDICPTSCRVFGDLSDPESAPSRALRGQSQQVLRQELGLGPNVRYLGLPAELDR